MPPPHLDKKKKKLLFAWLLVREVGDVQGYIPVPRYGKVRKTILREEEKCWESPPPPPPKKKKQIDNRRKKARDTGCKSVR